MAGLCAVCALFPAGNHALAQDAGRDAGQGASKQVASPPAAEPAPAMPSLNDLSLDELIPEDAVGNAESWAGQGSVPDGSAVGTAAEAPVEAAIEAAIEEDIDIDDVSQVAESQLESANDAVTAATFEGFDIPEPGRLDPDPAVTALADIDAPDLIELPDLREFRISDELILAFPEDSELFPERAQFIARFKALSTLETLESGDDTVPQLAARARADQTLLADMLRTYGYYDGEVVRQLSGGRRSGDGSGESNGENNADENGREGGRGNGGDRVDTDPQVRFDILPGERYVFGAIDLGSLDTAPDFAALRDRFAIQPGDPLQSDRIVGEQASLRLALGESGYPFAEIDAPSLLIDHARSEGDLTLPIDPGGKYVFGGIASEDPRFLSGKHLSRIARFETGDVYQTSLQADLRRAILATGLVSSVTVQPREIAAPQDGEPGLAVLDVDFERAPLRTIAGAFGYGTEDGVKVEASWEHRNLFPSEGSLALRGILGTREQLASITFKKNNFRDRDQILTVDAYASDIDTDAVDARTIALRGSFERVSNLLFQKPFSWQIGAEVLYTDERNRVIGGIERPRQEYTIFGLFGSATLDSSDDLLDPTEGYRLTGFLAPEVSRSLGEETFYLRAQGDATYYNSVGSTVLAGRLRAATIQGADAGLIAPSRRLYSGGGGSVRGYAFQGIGPRNDLGDPTGGGSLVELSFEARIQTGLLDGAVEIVPFIDAGSVALGSTPDFRSIQYGAGVGVRYKTSFGPIRVDVGVPINPTEFDAPVVVYVGLGQSF